MTLDAAQSDSTTATTRSAIGRWPAIAELLQHNLFGPGRQNLRQERNHVLLHKIRARLHEYGRNRGQNREKG